MALSDLTDDDAVDYVQGRLRRLGVERALVRAGVRDGDVVHLGDARASPTSATTGIDAAVAGAGPLPETTTAVGDGSGTSR